MKFPTMDEFAQMVADKALDEVEFNGKTIREWTEIILATDINVATKDGTNLAEVGTDVPDNNVGELISRQSAIDAIKKHYRAHDNDLLELIAFDIEQLPSAQPKRGKWIRTGSGSLYDHYECSECGKAPKWECMGDNRWKIAFTDFCPNCGAKMEVNHESN